MSRESHKERVLTLFIIPALAIYLFFFIFPMFSGLYYSLTDWDGMAKTKNFVGIANYVAVFKDPYALTATVNTLIYTVVVTLFSNLIGLTLALLLERRSTINNLFRTIYFVPAVLSPVVASFIWKYMYAPESGVINSLLQVIGAEGLAQDWLGNPKLALASVMIVPLWQWGGNVMIVYLAGLMNIPGEYADSARIDGATYLQKLRHITFPLLRPAFIFNIIISTIGSFKTFDFIFILTYGGPGFTTEVLTLQVYKYTLYTAKFGYGSALAVMLTIMIVIFSIVELKILTRREEKYV
jgi:raffinose/stachyose/melibiose transport system permease protein